MNTLPTLSLPRQPATAQATQASNAASKPTQTSSADSKAKGWDHLAHLAAAIIDADSASHDDANPRFALLDALKGDDAVEQHQPESAIALNTSTDNVPLPHMK